MRNVAKMSEKEYIEYKKPFMIKTLKEYFQKQRITKDDKLIEDEAVALSQDSYFKLQTFLKRISQF